MRLGLQLPGGAQALYIRVMKGRACRYDVYWTESSIEWASRWDAYLSMPNGSVHWFSILNSLLVVMVMSVIVAVILMRTVRRDLAKYEELLVEGQVRATVSQIIPFLLSSSSAAPYCINVMAFQLGHKSVA